MYSGIHYAHSQLNAGVARPMVPICTIYNCMVIIPHTYSQREKQITAILSFIRIVKQKSKNRNHRLTSKGRFHMHTSFSSSETLMGRIFFLFERCVLRRHEKARTFVICLKICILTYSEFFSQLFVVDRRL